MDAAITGAAQWELIGRALPNLVLFVAMMVNGTISFLLGHAIIPSVAMTAGMEGQFRIHRTVLYAVSAASIALMVWALYRAVVLIAIIVRDLYPRFAV